MRVSYTDEALRDLDAVVAFIELNYPAILPAFEQRLGAVERRIGGPRVRRKSNSDRMYVWFRSIAILTNYFIESGMAPSRCFTYGMAPARSRERIATAEEFRQRRVGSP